MPQPDTEPRDTFAAIDRLVDEYRVSCLWFLRPDFYPRTQAERMHVLQSIERHGTVDAYQRARTLRQWLSPQSSDRSVAS